MVEVDIRTIKSTMGMDVMRCKSPEMVRKEIWVHLLSYNLIRQQLLEAANKSGISPRAMSFTAALDQVAANWTANVYMTAAQQACYIAGSLHNLAERRVGNRLDRVEPRAVKRRPKPHKLLTKPREEARRDPAHVAGKGKSQ